LPRTRSSRACCAGRRRGFRTDLIYWFSTPVLTKAISQVGLVALMVLVYRIHPADVQQLLASRDTLLGSQPLMLQAGEMLLVGDLIGYWMHRLFHGRRLWKFHAIHHSSRDLDWLSTVRAHPVNDSLMRWAQASALVMLGFQPAAIAAYVPFLALYALFIHANVPWGFGRFGWLLASPRFHRWHHSTAVEGRNFAGLFPFIDRIFGTYFMPPDRLPRDFGLKDERVPEDFVGQLIYPFRRA
jgi:sterol desaturase/sphingolipid hydroxylase (fatty acid hydroxylase superfamily)